MELQEKMSQDETGGKSKFMLWYGVLFILCLTLLTILHLAAPDRSFSETEKRVLAKAPAFSAEALAQGRFTDELETYLADQFPKREALMQLRMRLEYLLGRRESQGVYYGDGDYLMEKFNTPGMEIMGRTATAVRGFLQRHPESKAYFVLVPTQADLMAEKLPSYAENADQDAYIDSWYSALKNEAVSIDVREAMRSAMAEGVQVYYRSDHHWTADGALSVLDTVEDAMGLAHRSFERAVVFNRFSGSLSAKSGWSLPVYDSIVMYTSSDPDFRYYIQEEESGEKFLSCYDAKALSGYDPYEFYFGGNYPMLTVETSADTERTLLVFKDSYANSFLPFLFEDYRKIVIIDPRYYSYSADTLFLLDQFDDILFLYNAETLAEDTSLRKVMEPL
ncbi:MAG: hypothetical protein II882_08700 [Lachnospiraceae bacterium]|nr:hypothetical protein [Lachnospiraceae bacterium]